ncbi:MAG: hypothetical protein K9I35_01895 [Flavobacterium sp.]|jgi:hypothetical protein|nr:hypothetical protein [Flavobacterium sp.]
MKLFLTFFLASLTTVFGQKLNFDIMVEYTTTYENSNYDKSAYAMSSNDNYILKIVSYADGQKIAYVADLKGLKSHEFSITESIIENDLKNIKFTYIKTVKHKFARTMARGIYFDFVSESNNDGVETVKLNSYKNKAKTKLSNSLELKIIKSEVNLFPLFRFLCLHPFEYITELNYNGAGLVTNCINKNGLKIHVLKAIEEANLELTIPNLFKFAP